MGKFIKSVIEKARQKKSALKLTMAMKGQQGIYTFFSIWFWTIEQFAGGSPSALAVQSMNVYLIPFTPGDWVCTDGQFKGVKAKRRLKMIKSNWAKDKVVKDVDKKWLLDELKVGFEDDMREKNLDVSRILVDLPEEEISKNISRVKSEKKFKEMLK